MLDYKEFLNLPEIREAFNDMYEKQKQHFRNESFDQRGFDKQHLEIASIKMSVISTDFYFTEIHKNKYLK
jgi:hypothetical protein